MALFHSLVESVLMTSRNCGYLSLEDGKDYGFQYMLVSSNIKQNYFVISDVNSTILPIVRQCHVNKALPTNDMYQCKEPDVVLQQWSTYLPFKHNDRQVLQYLQKVHFISENIKWRIYTTKLTNIFF